MDRNPQSNKKQRILYVQSLCLVLIPITCRHYSPSWTSAQLTDTCFLQRTKRSKWECGVHSECTHTSRKAIKAVTALFWASQAGIAQIWGWHGVMFTDGGEQAEHFTSHLAPVTWLRRLIFPRERVVQSLCSEEIAGWGVRRVWTRA